MDVKHKVLQSWVRCANRARDKIEERKTDLACQTYELEIAERVLAKVQDNAHRETWQMQVDVLAMLVGQTESDIEEQQEDQALCETMMAEIEADLATE
ncbi:MAG: hypothetical protein JXA33_01255 [Anaerolineae bacterium]|nr:hypothetical protein [Anaerolineae bacterium]